MRASGPVCRIRNFSLRIAEPSTPRMKKCHGPVMAGFGSALTQGWPDQNPPVTSHYPSRVPDYLSVPKTICDLHYASSYRSATFSDVSLSHKTLNCQQKQKVKADNTCDSQKSFGITSFRISKENLYLLFSWIMGIRITFRRVYTIFRILVLYGMLTDEKYNKKLNCTTRFSVTGLIDWSYNKSLSIDTSLEEFKLQFYSMIRYFCTFFLLLVCDE